MTGVKFREKFLSATFFPKESGKSIHNDEGRSGAVGLSKIKRQMYLNNFLTLFPYPHSKFEGIRKSAKSKIAASKLSFSVLF
jgi:hypothetical protein